MRNKDTYTEPSKRDIGTDFWLMGYESAGEPLDKFRFRPGRTADENIKLFMQGRADAIAERKE